MFSSKSGDKILDESDIELITIRILLLKIDLIFKCTLQSRMEAVKRLMQHLKTWSHRAELDSTYYACILWTSATLKSVQINCTFLAFFLFLKFIFKKNGLITFQQSRLLIFQRRILGYQLRWFHISSENYHDCSENDFYFWKEIGVPM